MIRGRLFWNIVLGFWLTTCAITLGVWLLVAWPSDDPHVVRLSGADQDILHTAVDALHEGGEPALRAAIAHFPQALQRKLAVTRDEHFVSVQADEPRAPGGTRYRLAFDGLRVHVVYNQWPFNIPVQLILVSVLGGLAFGSILAWYMTRPIHRIREGFGRLAQGDFSTRLSPAMRSRHDEIADLARDFDVMAERLEDLVAARDRMLASVSHELRSPLSRLQLAVGLARQDPAKADASLHRIADEAARLNEMVDELLVLSRLENGLHNNDEYFDVAEILRIVAEDASFEARPHGVEVSMSVEAPRGGGEWVCPGSGKLVAHAFENIVRNAVRFSRAGQAVKIALTDTGEGAVQVVMSDDGPGVPAESLRTLFQPFFQAVSDGQGFGLGLAIAERAILAHGGSVSARNKMPHGLVVTAVLPAIAAAT